MSSNCENITLPNQLKCKCDLLKPRTHSFPLDEKFIKNGEIAWPTNGEIGPVADQIYEIWNYTIFLIRVFKESLNCVYIPNIPL